MAEPGLNPQQVQYMIAAMQNPQAAMQLQQRQQLAQQMMQQGAQQPDPNETINEGIGGAHTVPFNKWGGLARAAEQMSGAYLQNQNNQKLGDMMKAAQQQNQQPSADNGQALGNQLMGQVDGVMGPGTPTRQDIFNEQLAPGWTKAQNDLRNSLAEKGLTVSNGQIIPIPGYNQAAAGTAGAVKGAETSNSIIQTPEGPALGNILMGGNRSTPAPQNNASSVSSTYMPQSPSSAVNPTNVMPNAIAGTTPGAPMPPAPQMMNGKPVAPQNMDDLLNEQSQNPAQPPKQPVAGDGMPLLPNLKQIPPPNPQGLPQYNTPNTTSGVNLNKQLTDGDQKANAAFANESQSLAQEQTRIQNLINTYQQVKSGTLTAQDPAFFQKLAAAGISDSPEQLKSLAGIQNATQNHILQIIGQIKDTNASLEGGQASRTFGSTINKLTEEGESAKDQPEALWNIIAQAKGQVDHHLDMMQGYQTVGGMGNRLNAGATMPADTFATKFTLAHPIDSYVQKNLQTIAPFKGMPGNTGDGRISIIDPSGNAGTIDKMHLQSLLDAGGKLAP